MNWLISVIILQLIFGRIISEQILSCLQSKKCSCQKHVDKEEIEVLCNTSTITVNLMESLIEVQCNSNQIQWERSFDQINVTDLNYKHCPLNTEIHQVMSTLGIINEVQNINLIYIKFNGSLESTYFSKLESVKQLDISYTKLVLTNESFKGTPYLTKLFLRQNGIEELPMDVFKHLHYLEILDLGGNKLSEINVDPFLGVPLKGLVLDSNNLITLNLNIKSLKRLDVSNNRLISLEVNNLNSLVEISLNKNIQIAMQDQPFKNTSLEYIKYNFGHLNIPQKFLTNLDRLSKVHLKFLNLKTVPEDMIWNSPNITEMSLASNLINELPVFLFRDSKKMKILDLSKNKIENINNELFKPLINLETLNLSNNLIVKVNNYGLRYLRNLVFLNLERNQIITIEREALNVPNLKQLNLSYNKICNLSVNNLFILHYLDDLEVINLSNNNLTHINQEWVNLVKLKSVNLARNNFIVLRINDFQYFNEKVKIDLNSNPIEEINLSDLLIFVNIQPQKENLFNTQPRGEITISGNKLICDCRNYEFARYIQNKMPKTVYKYLRIEQSFTCMDGTEFTNIKIDNITCDWKLFNDADKIDCPECECAYRPYDNSAIMNCSNRNLISAPKVIVSSKNINYTEVILKNNSISKLPDYKHLNIRKLNVAYNSLNSINITQLPKNLAELNLEHNNLTEISETTLSNKLTNLNVLTLSENSWKCDCEAKNTINFVRKYSSKIVDLNNVTCPSSTPLHTLSIENICQENYELKNIKIMAVSISLAVFGILLGLTLTLYNRYKIEIKIWLYSHNIIWPISEESLDQNKKYDAFISFSHKDDELVAKHLVPGLEGGNTPFKLCLHYRDWVVGDWIPAQIARSVDESRRTIIVLSQNFLDSVWGRTEFRTAYSSALDERRSRIIVILYGQLSTEDLDSELKAYLSTNTYIKWGDYWFWEKLRYALPRRPGMEKKTKTKIIVPDKLNPLKLV